MTNKITIHRNNTPIGLVHKIAGPTPYIIKEGQAPWKQEEQCAAQRLSAMKNPKNKI